METSNLQEQKLRKKYNVNWDPTEIEFEGSSLNKLLFIGFVGGFCAAAIGLGGASLYNPALLYLGVNPRVAAATGMYIVIWTQLNACILNYLSGYLYVKYGLFLGACNVLGSILGLFFSNWYYRKSGRASIFVFALAFVFLLSVVLTPFLAYQDISRQVNNGMGMLAFSKICP